MSSVDAGKTSNDSTSQPPSELYNTQNPGVAEPTVIDTPAQQGAPEPGSGSTVEGDHGVPFKDQMIGYAKSIRGSVLRQPETKKTGDAILQGDISAKEYFEQKNA